MATTLERTAEMSGVSRLTVSRVIIAEPNASARSLELRAAGLRVPEYPTVLDRDELAPARGVEQSLPKVRQRPGVSGAGEKDRLIDVSDDPLVTDRRFYRFDPARGARFLRRGPQTHERKAHSATN